MPARIEELTSRFVRQKDEPLRKFVTRLDTIVARLQAVHCHFLDQYLGHILLTRAAIPDWQVPTARSQITGPLDKEKVRKVLYHMFGPDHVPNARDVARVTKSMGDEVLAADFDLDEANSHGSPSPVGWDADESYFEGEEEPEAEDYEEETPPELEAAARQTEEAYTTWVEARRQMNDLARARGFFPVSQTLQYFKPPTPDSSSPSRESKGRGKGKKRGRSRGVPSTGKGSTRSSPPPAAAPPPTATSPTKSTASGSTQQHGPRFKRVRRPDDVHLIEEVEIVQAPAEEETLVVETGKGAADSGATSSLIGLETWKKLKAEILKRNPAVVIEERPTYKKLRFGDSKVEAALFEAVFPIHIFGTAQTGSVHVVPGTAPLVFSRPFLEKIGMVIDFRSHLCQLKDSPERGWIPLEQSENGHFVLDMVDAEEEIPDEGPCSSSSDASEEVESEECQEGTLWINSVVPDCLVVQDLDNEMLPQKMDEMKQQCEAWPTEASMLTLKKETDKRVEPTVWEVLEEERGRDHDGTSVSIPSD